MTTYKLTISYDGTDFCGWQVQPGQRSVQGVVEAALKSVFNGEFSVTGSGRTDAGVHALGQTVSFTVDTELSLPYKKIPAALNFYLPEDVRVNLCEKAEEGFNARKSALKKTYHYYFYLSDTENPILNKRALRCAASLNIKDIIDAAGAFNGRHDFKAFYAVGSSAKTTVREVYGCKVEPCELFGIKCFRLVITANGFLYKMVRLITGALISLGSGKLNKDDLINQLNGALTLKNRIAAKPCGLYLYSVEY